METPFFDKLIDMYEHYYCNGWLSDQEEEQYFEFKKIKKFIQIELPSDEEIEKEAILLKTVSNVPIIHSKEYIYWKEGAKWVIDKIKNQQ